MLVRFRYQTDEIVDVGFFERWFIDDIEINSANWTTIAEVPRTHLDVTGKLSGTYFYACAASSATRASAVCFRAPGATPSTSSSNADASGRGASVGRLRGRAVKR